MDDQEYEQRLLYHIERAEKKDYTDLTVEIKLIKEAYERYKREKEILHEL